MTKKVISILSAGRNKGFLRWLSGEGKADDEGGLQATFIGYFNHPVEGEIQAHAKFYLPEKSGSKALANEITGYVLANQMKLAQPSPAFIAEIPLKKIDLNSLPKHHQWLKKLSKTEGVLYAWCTKTESYPTPWHLYGASMISAIQSDLAKWPQALSATTLDHFLANIDRNLNNLIRISSGNYSLIDHGSLVCSQGIWDKKQLLADDDFQNKLFDILFQGSEISNAASAMIIEAEKHNDLSLILPELNFWWGRFLTIPDHEAFNAFIQTRVSNAPERLAKRYSLLC